MNCKTCGGVGKVEGPHLPGFTHYETDAGEPCPAYHFARIPCPDCAKDAEIATLREQLKECGEENARLRFELGSSKADDRDWDALLARAEKAEAALDKIDNYTCHCAFPDEDIPARVARLTTAMEAEISKDQK